MSRNSILKWSLVKLQFLLVLGQGDLSMNSNTRTGSRISITESWVHNERDKWTTTVKSPRTWRTTAYPNNQFDIPNRDRDQNPINNDPKTMHRDRYSNPIELGGYLTLDRYSMTREPDRYWNARTRNTTATTTRYPSYVSNEEIDTHPSVDFSVIDTSTGNLVTVDWFNRRNVNKSMAYTVKEATVGVRHLRQFQLRIICNASYPIELISPSSFEAKEWELDEFRHFPTRRVDAIYSLALDLEYTKPDNMPKKQVLVCRALRNAGNSWESKHEIYLELKPTSDYKSLNAEMFKNGQQTSGELITDRERNELSEYSEDRGANTQCNMHFTYDKRSGKFTCYFHRNAEDNTKTLNLTIDYTDCDDFANCRRKYKQATCGSSDQIRRNKQKAVRPTELWSEHSPAPSGIVYCKKDGDKNNWNESAAVAFFYSLPPLCPDDNNERIGQELYVGAPIQRLDLNLLQSDFISFCPSAEVQVDDNPGNQERRLSVYQGENITVSCFSSIYHFAEGTKIKVSSGYGDEYATVFDGKTTKQKTGTVRGFYNFTGKICIKSKSIREIKCENFLKRSRDSVTKSIIIDVKSPKNISFEGGSTPITYIYNGQENFQMVCEARGDPVPKIRWKKPGRIISDESTSPLEIISESNAEGTSSILKFPSNYDEERLNAADLYGTFTCEAWNTLDTLEKTFIVTPSDSKDLPVVIDTMGNVVQPQLQDESASSWIVWAIVVPILLVFAFVIIGSLMWKIRKQGKELSALTKAEVDEFILGKPEFLQHHSSSEEVNNYAPYLPYNKSYEIGRDQLELDENAVIGSGAYAVVLKGTLNMKSGDRLSVAIKTAKPMDDVSFFKALLSELKIMGFIGTHPNIVNLVGAHTKNIINREVFIAIEFCHNGNILTFLRDNRPRFVNLVGPNGDLVEKIVGEGIVKSTREGFNTVMLMKWAEEVANGMEFLSGKKVIHGDLAARNILLNQHLIAKIGDFGLSRQLFEYANYIKKQHSPLPWKWLAIESLQDMRFSVKSDVWAYGILLFEIFSLGQVPYPGYSYNDEFLDSLVEGKRPNKPSYASNKIYEMMECCWRERPEDRPTFTQVKKFFTDKLERFVPLEYLNDNEKIKYSETAGISRSMPGTQNETLTAKGHFNSSWNEVQRNESRFSFNKKTLTTVFHRS